MATKIFWKFSWKTSIPLAMFGHECMIKQQVLQSGHTWPQNQCWHWEKWKLPDALETSLSLCTKCVCVFVCVCALLSHIWLFVTLWTTAHQASSPMGFFSWRSCHFLFQRSSNIRIEPATPVSPALHANSWPTELLGGSYSPHLLCHLRPSKVVEQENQWPALCIVHARWTSPTSRMSYFW